MTSKERMKRAMDRRTPDRVPVMCQMSFGHMLLQTRSAPSEFWFSAELFAEGLIRLRELYGFDGFLVSLFGHPAGWKKMLVEIRKHSDGEEAWWQNGDRTYFPFDDLPQHRPQIQPPLPSVFDFDVESIPEEVDAIPVSQGLLFPLDSEHTFDVFNHIRSRTGTRFSIHGEVTSPFDYFLNLFGHDNALAALIEEPSRCEAVLNRYCEAIKKLALAQVAWGVDAVKISSPFAGSGFISPRFYRRFVLPYEGEIATAVRSKNTHIYTHTCGAVGDRLESIVESGISGLECLDPPPLGDVDLRDAVNRVGDRVFIKGNIDPVHTLLYGSEKEVEEDARMRIETAKRKGGYILSSACSIAPHTPRRNVQALLRTAEKHGTY